MLLGSVIGPIFAEPVTYVDYWQTESDVVPLLGPNVVEDIILVQTLILI